jgi:hypothetical protein
MKKLDEFHYVYPEIKNDGWDVMESIRSLIKQTYDITTISQPTIQYDGVIVMPIHTTTGTVTLYWSDTSKEGEKVLWVDMRSIGKRPAPNKQTLFKYFDILKVPRKTSNNVRMTYGESVATKKCNIDKYLI